MTITAGVTSAELLLAWQNKRTAERKPGLSMSALGGCRRRAGYLITNTPASNQSGSVQSAMGSAAHEKIAEAAAEMLPDDLIEYAVTFAGIPGTLDRYDATHATLIDTKTTSSRWLAHIRVHGPGQSHLWQISGYGAALIAEGRPVRTVIIDYLARDTGEEYRWSAPFDPQAVRDALAWVATIRDTSVDMLPRDYAPESQWCAGCPFRDVCWEGSTPGRDPRSVLYVEDPDGPGWAAKLWQARRDQADAKAREAEAKGALDALRPDDPGEIVDVGWEKALRWTTTWPERLDTAAVRAEYRKTGALPPMKVAEKPTIRLDFVAREDVTP